MNPEHAIATKILAPELIGDLAELFATDASAGRCWCMWFIGSVRHFHARGPVGNRAMFEALARASDVPLGLIAYRADRPIGWCAVGPAGRFDRAIATPTLKPHMATTGADAWLLPCFFVRSDQRRSGVTRALIEAAAAMAAARGARLLLGFPYAGGRPRTRGDPQVGTEDAFARCGFESVHRPSGARVVMQRFVGSV